MLLSPHGRRYAIAMTRKIIGGTYIPAGRKPWPHELRVAGILANAGYRVEFIPESNSKTPDISMGGVKYEIKSPLTISTNTLEHLLKRALRQSPNIIVDTSRMRKNHDDKVKLFLSNQARMRRQIRRLIMISKSGQIIDIK